MQQVVTFEGSMRMRKKSKRERVEIWDSVLDRLRALHHLEEKEKTG
jgi:hypothetical protein